MANSVTGSVWRQGIPMAGWNGNQALTVGRGFLQGRNGGFSGEGKRRTEGGLSWAPGYGSERAQIAGVQSLCPLFATPWIATRQAPVLHHLPELVQTQVSDAIQPSHPLSSPSPPAFNLPQHQGLFQWVGSLHQVAKVSKFQLQHQSFNEYSGLISFGMDWMDLLAVQGTLKSLLQHHSSKASMFWCSAFFTVQLSHPYMTTGKTIALTRRAFVGKVMSLLFNMLSEFVIAFLPRSYCLLTSE